MDALIRLASSSPLAVIAIVLGISLLLWQTSSQPADPREPPAVKSRIPIYGHVIGMLRHSAYYTDILCAQNPSYPIFSISFLGQTQYIITDPNLIAAAHRSKSLSFQAVVRRIEQRYMDSCDEMMALMTPIPGGLNGEEESPYTKDRITAMHTPFVPGPGLNRLNSAVLNAGAKYVNAFTTEWEEHNLWLWIRDMFTSASSRGTFGTPFPVADNPELIQALWDFDAEGLKMILLPFPSIFARKALAARTLLHKKLREWYNAGHYNAPDFSTAARARMDCNRTYGIQGDELGADLLGLLFVSTTNAAPTLFWLFTRVFSLPSLLEEIRTELESVLIKGEGDKMVIDHTKFPTHCPLLCSAYQEVMRVTNIQASTRLVVQDTVLVSSSDENGEKTEFLVKKGSLVQTPAGVTHVAPSVWGPSAEEFDPRRFMKLRDGNKVAEKQQKKAFIPFGGGKHLCPGRHFAFAEILGIIALLAMGFDVEGAGGRPLEVPKGVRGFANAVLKTDAEGYNMGFRIRRRQEWEKTQWGFVEA